jgi:hypothetical protein
MNTKTFIDKVASGEANEAKDIINDILSSRAFEALDAKKVEIAQSLYNNEEVEVQNTADTPMEDELLTQEEFDALSDEDKELYEVYSTMSRLKRKFIPGQGQKQAGERAKDQGYSAALDREALKYHPDDKKLQTTMKSSEKAQQRYKRISRGEAPFKSSPND